MHIPFTRGERQELLNQYFPAYKRWQDLDYQIAVRGKSVPADPGREYDELGRMLMDLRGQYKAGLPFLPVSRCPFSAQVVYHSIDPFGIEGLWWNYDVPVRPVENLPATVHAVTGALRINGPIADAPFLCAPGPGAPYVVPAIISPDQVTAVISSLPIGSHTGYVILYFIDSDEAQVPRANSWGMNHWEMARKDGTFSWGEGNYGIHDADFDLFPWVEKKKLLWIRPKDRTLVLQSGTTGCPYLWLDGPRHLQRVRAGKVQQEGVEE